MDLTVSITIILLAVGNTERIMNAICDFIPTMCMGVFL